MSKGLIQSEVWQAPRRAGVLTSPDGETPCPNTSHRSRFAPASLWKATPQPASGHYLRKPERHKHVEKDLLYLLFWLLVCEMNCVDKSASSCEGGKNTNGVCSLTEKVVDLWSGVEHKRSSRREKTVHGNASEMKFRGNEKKRLTPEAKGSINAPRD
mgnify:CR=1 FL=1